MVSIETVYNKLSTLIPKPNRKGSAVGLDIGTSCVKLVKTDVHDDVKTVSVLGLEKIKEGNVGDAVKILLDKTSVQEKNVNIGISGKQTIIRCVMLPDMTEAEFKNSMKYEAAKHIPFSVDDVILDFTILKHDIESNKMLVLVAAAKKDFVQERLKIISDLGLVANVLDIDSLAVINMFNLVVNSKDQNTAMSAILNLGAQFSSLAILEGDLLRFGRDIAFGGDTITHKISAKLGINFTEAEKIKLTPSHPPEIRQIIESGLTDLLGELRLSLDYYESQTGKAVEYIYLSGGSSCLEGIDKFMNETMGITFKLWDPLSGLRLDESLDENLTHKFPQCFAVAAGLSLR